MCPLDSDREILFVNTTPEVYLVKDARRAYYTESTSLSKDTLYKMFAGGESNIELIAEVYGMTGLSQGVVIRVSDRPKYVGRFFYHGRVKFPKIERKLPPLLSSQLSFSELELVINNCDGFYNDLLIGGNKYSPFVGAAASFSVGLRDLQNTYFSVFRGTVHAEGGVERTKDTITLRAREYFEYFNSKAPFPTITAEEFPSAPKESIGKMIPLVIGDWSEGVVFSDTTTTASVDVGGENSIDVKLKTTEELAGGITGYNVGDDWFIISVGSIGQLNIRMENIEDCVLKRSGTFYKTAFSPSPQVTGDAAYWAVRIGGLIRDSDGQTVPYVYTNGDTVVVRVKVGCWGLPAFEAADANPIQQAKALLYSAAVALKLDFSMSDFSSKWDTLAAKFSMEGFTKVCNITNGSNAVTFTDPTGVSVGNFIVSSSLTPGSRIISKNGNNFIISGKGTTTTASNVTVYPNSAVNTKSRIWVGDSNVNVLEYAVGLLRQVRCDIFVNKARQIDIATQHFEDIPSQDNSSRHIEMSHILEDTINPQIDRKNNMTSANASYAFSPAIQGAARLLPKFSNSVSEDRLSAETAKTFELPNLYIKEHAEVGLAEMLRFYSGLTEEITLSTAWIHMDAELSEYATLSVSVGSVNLDRALCQVRSISIAPEGGSVELKLLSFANFRVPNYNPENYTLNLAGYDSIITVE